MEIKKAERTQLKLRLALMGPSGSGKTYSALALGSGLGKKILLVDTENHSSSTYADEFGFDVINIDPPYTVDKYLMAMRMGVAQKYDVIVLDSISHEWAGEGGLLEQKNAMDAKGGNQWTNWAKPTKEHEKFKSAILTVDAHLIATVRSKEEYVLEANSQGKMVPVKKGMGPVQREGIAFEFGVVFELDMKHVATVTKTRLKFLDGKEFVPSEEIGKSLKEWLETGKVESLPKSKEDEQRETLALQIEEKVTSETGGDLSKADELIGSLTQGKMKIADLRVYPVSWLEALNSKLMEAKA